MSTVYPISSASPPYTPNIKEEKRGIEEREAERRKRIVRSNSFVGTVEKEEDGWWSLDKVETFYTECCAGREEPANPSVSAALQVRVHANM
jgi:protein phosphatase 1 regulatory subunit 37